MPEISQWELDKLREHEQAYYELLEERNALIDALNPFIIDIVKDKIKSTLKED